MPFLPPNQQRQSTEGTTSQQVTRLKTNVTAVTFCEKEAQFADEKSDIDGAK